MLGDILFSKYLLFLIILFHDVGSSDLLSRFRNRHNGPRSDLEIIKNLDDKTYEDLMNEIPLLKNVFQGNRKDETFQFNSSALPMLYRGEVLERPHNPPIMVSFDVGSLPAISDRPTTYSNSSLPSRKSMTYRTRWPNFKQRTTNARRWFFDSLTVTAHWHTVYPHVSSCYWCGLNESTLPHSSVCYSIWDSDDTRSRDLGRFFRARCYYYDQYRFYDRQIKLVRWYPSTVEYKYDHGLKTAMFGPYMKGCFKRFVDVGPLYTARGCRGAYLPWRTYTSIFAGHRLMRMEIIARGHDDVCVHSPEASLTPYSRAISLFVRYHVCVCPTSYCNAAAPFEAHFTATLAFIVPLTVIKQMS